MKLKVKHLVKDFNLKVLAGENALNKSIKAEMLSRPGVEMAGFFDYFDKDRVILIGSKEYQFMQLLPPDIRRERVSDIMAQKPPCMIFSVNVEVEKMFYELSAEYDIAILKSDMRTTPLFSLLYAYLHAKLAPRQSVHGVLVDIHGMGTLITGESGIGKSEVALELIKRGHILISDDRVDIFEASPGTLVGSAPELLERYIEIRGIGIVDVVSMFGAGAYRENKKVRLVVELEHWQRGKAYDRLGLETETVKFFNTEIAKITIPILPGRNVATLIESAAMNQKLKYLGHHAAMDLADAVARKASGVDKDEDEDD